jgi:hypothetical protein
MNNHLLKASTPMAGPGAAPGANAGVGQVARKFEPQPLSPLPEQPLVSILIRNYNYANYIGMALESVLDQTYGHFEAAFHPQAHAKFIEGLETVVPVQRGFWAAFMAQRLLRLCASKIILVIGRAARNSCP